MSALTRSEKALDSAAGSPVVDETPAEAVIPSAQQQPLPASELQSLGPITLPATGHQLTVPLNQRVLSYI